MRWKLDIRTLALGAILIGAQESHAIVAGKTPTRDEIFQEYQAIVDRNPFGLKPIPPPVTNAPAPPHPVETKVEIFLTGITSVVKPKKVYLKSVEANPKDPKQKENFYSLSEGQSKDGIEILEINDKKREVRIKTGTEEKVLNFAQNGIKAPAGAPPPPSILGVPGAPGMPPPGQPQMGGNLNAAFNPAGANPNQPTITPINTYTPSTPIRSIPSRPTRTTDQALSATPGVVSPGYGAAPAVANPQPQVSPEEQYLMLKANQEIARRAHQKGLGPEPPPVPDFHLQ